VQARLGLTHGRARNGSIFSGMRGEIRDRARLTEVFGRWPSFHDAEVLRVRMEALPDRRLARLEADFHVFEITDELTPTGHYALRHHTLVTLRFDGIDELALECFGDQNVLFGLRLEDITDRQLEWFRWSVAFDASVGLNATFLCAEIAVISVEPFTPGSS
jgi:hypothetical protein